MSKPAVHRVATDGERGLRVTLLGVLVLGIRRRNLGATVNALLALLGTFVPTFLERLYDVEFEPWQRLYVGTAMVTHAVGMLGPYDDVWWWDHLTHTHSATLVGGIVHVVSRRRGTDPAPRVVTAVAVLGVAWELAEYSIHWVANAVGIEPILMTYGRKDTVFDLCFNALGALIVLAFGDEALQNLAGGDDDEDRSTRR